MSAPVTELSDQFPDAELQTDKDTGKIVYCVPCEAAGDQTPLIVNAFYAASKAKCVMHRPQETETGPDATTPNAHPVEDLVSNHPDAEIQTDKPNGKVVICRGCEKELIVNSFYAPSKAQCTECRGGPIRKPRAPGTQAVVQPGKTDPAKAEDLTKVLINPQFAKALCPVHPDDEEHVMELKHVSQHPHHGPCELIGYKGSQPEYRQIAPGETVMHQCLKCKATVSYSTTAQSQFRRQNEISDNKHVNGWVAELGAREEVTA